MKNWIQQALSNGAHKGALHEELGIPQGQKIPQDVLQNAAQAGGKLGQRARFAMNMHHINKPSSPWTKMGSGNNEGQGT